MARTSEESVVDERTVVELEFAMEDDAFLVSASEGEECEIELETVAPRSDGTVLEFLIVRGADPHRFVETLQASPGIREARLLNGDREEALFEVISESRIATSLADEETLFKQITARAGKGRLVAEVPPHIDVSKVIASFLEEHPGAQLVARRETTRQAPTLSRAQLLTTLLQDLTEKQLRVLRVAYANGYFEWPRERTAEELAETLEISTPTFSQHLRVAERKLLDAVFE